MALLNQEQQDRVAQAIKDVESRTNAELVTVLAKSSDDYRYIPLLWAAIVSLFIPGALYFTPLDLEWVVWSGAIAFAVLAFMLYPNEFRIRLIPREVRTWRAANMARRQFLALGLHHTEGETGVLIFVSEAEHYVEVLVDRGIATAIDNQKWESIVRDFIAHVRSKRIEAGFVNCLVACGDLLEEAVPKTEDNKNELDDRLILIGYN